MLVTNMVFVKINIKNIEWFTEKKYKKLICGKEIIVKTLDLMPAMKIPIEVICDYCLENGVVTFVQKIYKDYYNGRKEIEKDCCLSCFKTKGREIQYYKFGSKTKCSKQQLHIHSIIGGLLNFPVLSYSLDIAYIEEKIYFEYDGGGHDLKVTLGHITKENFNEKEIIRRNEIRSRGWKEIRLVSIKDLLPKDQSVINYMLVYSRALFSLTQHQFVEFNIDDNTLKTSDGIFPFYFGELIKAPKIQEAVTPDQIIENV